MEKMLMTTPIIKRVVEWLLPFLWIFSFYIMIFGHLSPGGGFSGGSVLGACLILDRHVRHEMSFGVRFTGERLLKLALGALCLYALLKGQSFLFGMLHMEGLPVPLGTAGNILSSGLILPLNLLVGIVVAVAFYLIAVLFEEGSL
jgi:multicomponent Na+:H+ antiporter subunit B